MNCPDKKVGIRCKATQFKCANELCIPHRWTCDGQDDCGDNSDEVKCGKFLDKNISLLLFWIYLNIFLFVEITNCEANEFMCGDKQCISDVWRCNGKVDCNDGSDELNCTTDLLKESEINKESTTFLCNDGFSIPIRWRCDGGQECDQGEDEKVY